MIALNKQFIKKLTHEKVFVLRCFCFCRLAYP